MDKENKKPNICSNNKDEQFLCSWIYNQVANYKNKMGSMNNEERQQMWEEFFKDEKYKDYFIDNDEVWNTKFEEVKKFMDDNKKRPNKRRSINEDENVLGCWITHQIQNYKKKQRAFNTEERRKIWEEFVEKYKEYLVSDDEKWDTKFEELKQFMHKYKKRPSDK